MIKDCPKLVSDFEVYETKSIITKKTLYIIGSKTTDRSIKIDSSKINFINELKILLNGNNSIQEIEEELSFKNYQVEFKEILNIFKKNGFIEGVKGITTSEVDLTSTKLIDIPVSKKISKLNLLCKILIMLYPYIITSLITFIFINKEIFNELILNKKTIIASIPLSILAIFIHELGHLVYAIANNINIHRIRMSLLWGIMPMIYIKYHNLYFIDSRKRLFLILAGINANFGFALLSILIYFNTKNALAISFFYLNIMYIIINLYPHQTTDGYFALSTLFNKHNLRIEIIYSLFKAKKQLNKKEKIMIIIYFLLIILSCIGIWRMIYTIIYQLFPNELNKYSVLISISISLLILFQVVLTLLKLRKKIINLN